MTTFYKAIVACTMIGTLIGCGEGHYYEDDYHSHHSPVNEPSLYQFNMIDSYGVNTEFDAYTDLVVSPFISDGLFDVIWDADSHGSYVVELLLNDVPTPRGGRVIFDEYCSVGLSCYQHQYQYCEFTRALDMVCESSSGVVEYNDVGDMLYRSSQEMFLILQICDTSFYYCESQALPVYIEH